MRRAFDGQDYRRLRPLRSGETDDPRGFLEDRQSAAGYSSLRSRTPSRARWGAAVGWSTSPSAGTCFSSPGESAVPLPFIAVGTLDDAVEPQGAAGFSRGQLEGSWFDERSWRNHAVQCAQGVTASVCAGDGRSPPSRDIYSAICNDGVDGARTASGSVKSGARMVVVRATV
jgi:hypothetical protein